MTFCFQAKQLYKHSHNQWFLETVLPFLCLGVKQHLLKCILIFDKIILTQGPNINELFPELAATSRGLRQPS